MWHGAAQFAKSCEPITNQCSDTVPETWTSSPGEKASRVRSAPGHAQVRQAVAAETRVVVGVHERAIKRSRAKPVGTKAEKASRQAGDLGAEQVGASHELVQHGAQRPEPLAHVEVNGPATGGAERAEALVH